MFIGVTLMFVGIILSVVGDVRTEDKTFSINPLNAFSSSLMGTIGFAIGYIIVFGGAMMAMLLQGIRAVWPSS